MKKTKLAIMAPLILTLMVSCGQKKSETISAPDEAAMEDRISEVEPESVGLLAGTDVPMFDPYSCDANFIYGNVEICSEAHSEYNGNILSVVDYSANSGFKIGEANGCFFKGMSEEKLIVDQGTGNLRGLEIYDLSGKKVFSGNYINELRLEEKNLFFWNLVKADDLNEKPACADNWEGDPESLGFKEEYSLDLSSLEVKKTGNTDCQYLE